MFKTVTRSYLSKTEEQSNSTAQFKRIVNDIFQFLQARGARAIRRRIGWTAERLDDHKILQNGWEYFYIPEN